MKPSNLRSTISKSATRAVAFIGSLSAALTVAAVASAQDTDSVSSEAEPSTPSNAEAQPSTPSETPAPPAPVAPQEEPTAPKPPMSQAPPTARFPDAAPKPAATPPSNRKAQSTNPASTKPAGRQLESKPTTPKHQREQAATKSSAQPPSREQQDTELATNPQGKPTNKDKASDDDDSSGGLFGPIRLGPMVGVGLPNVLSFGGLLKLTRYLGGGLNIGLIPTVRVKYYGQATLLYQEYDIYGRIFPFGGGFFLGAGVGYEVVKGTMSDSMDTSTYSNLLPPGLSIPNPLTYQSAGSVKTMVLTPEIGYLYTTGIGFSIGIDVGAQLPIAPSQISFKRTYSAGTPPQLVSQVQTQFLDPINQNVKSPLQTIGRAPLPTINLRVGWLL